MKISNSIYHLPELIKQYIASGPLPGKEAHLRMAPPARIDSLKSELLFPKEAKKAAVLIPLYFKNKELYTVFIKRTEYDGVHSGQIAFPGGKMEETDPDFTSTAVREAEEEIGIDPEKVQVLGSLTPLYIPPSNFLIEPVIGFVEQVPHFVLQKEEVQGVIEIPVHFFCNRKEKQQTLIAKENADSFNVPCYQYHELVIWGATAMVISELIQVVEAVE